MACPGQRTFSDGNIHNLAIFRDEIPTRTYMVAEQRSFSYDDVREVFSFHDILTTDLTVLEQNNKELRGLVRVKIAEIRQLKLEIDLLKKENYNLANEVRKLNRKIDNDEKQLAFADWKRRGIELIEIKSAQKIVKLEEQLRFLKYRMELTEELETAGDLKLLASSVEQMENQNQSAVVQAFGYAVASLSFFMTKFLFHTLEQCLI